MNKNFILALSILSTLSACQVNLDTNQIAEMAEQGTTVNLSQVPQQEKTYTVGTFSDIHCQSHMKMKIQPSEKSKVVVISNALDYLTVKNNNGRLRIQYQKNVNLKNAETEIIVYTPSFQSLEASSLGAITVEKGFTSSKLRLTASSSGKISGPFSCTQLEVKSSSNGNIFADIQAQQLTASASSSGDIKLNSTSEMMEQIQLTSSSSGTITLKNGKAKTLYASASSSGDISGNFSADKINLTSSSSGDIDARISTKTLSLKASSSGDIKLSGEAQSIEASANSSGDINIKNVRYSNLEKSQNSSGKVITN